ncbi:MAG TPA: nucleotide exchange factor GrpE [Candidatus Saccharibacteria bacterium]|nr:nucleotide exchange factor GrpE [Candidatus Saccharibacteria bacterium]
MTRKSKKEIEFEQKIGEITEDLQRTRADFENYRKRSEIDRTVAREFGEVSIVLKLLPVIDNIERAVKYIPDELKDNSWVSGISKLAKNLEKSIEDMNLKKIDAKPGTAFNPELHEAIQFDESSSGDNEIISEEIQAGYIFNGKPIRHSMVKVARN